MKRRGSGAVVFCKNIYFDPIYLVPRRKDLKCCLRFSSRGYWRIFLTWSRWLCRLLDLLVHGRSPDISFKYVINKTTCSLVVTFFLLLHAEMFIWRFFNDLGGPRSLPSNNTRSLQPHIPSLYIWWVIPAIHSNLKLGKKFDCSKLYCYQFISK